MTQPTVREFFDPATWTLTYVVYDETTKDAIVIDPVWDYDPAASKLSAASAARVIEFVESEGLTVHLIAETHAHADHISGSQVLKKKWPRAKVAISARITEVQDVFKRVFGLAESFKTDGRQFDVLLADGESLAAGSLKLKAISTPGHTPACMSFVIGDAVFTGDALFMPDQGTGRCDFPKGSAADLYDSIHGKLYGLNDAFRIFVGHDYQPGGRALAFMSTVGEEKAKNIHLKQSTTREEFIESRTARDRTLGAPKLLLPSIQVNINAGALPEPDENGQRYLKIPIKANP